MKKKLLSIFAFMFVVCFALVGCTPGGGEDSIFVSTDSDIVDFYNQTLTPSVSVAYGAMLYPSEETQAYSTLMMGIGFSTTAALMVVPDAMVCVSYFNDMSGTISQENNIGYYDIDGILYKVEYISGKYVVSNGSIVEEEPRIYQVARVDGVYNLTSELGVSMQISFDSTVSKLTINCSLMQASESTQYIFETFMLRNGDIALRYTLVLNSGSNNKTTYTIETYTQIMGAKVKFAHAKGREAELDTKTFDEEKFALATTNDIGGFEYTITSESQQVSVRKYGQLA